MMKPSGLTQRTLKLTLTAASPTITWASIRQLSVITVRSLASTGPMSRLTSTGQMLTLTWNSLRQPSRTMRSAFRLNPEDSDAHFSRGLTYFRLGQYRAALDDYHQSLSIDSEDAEICAHATLAATLLGVDEEAEEFKDDAVELGFASEFLQIVIDELKKRRQLDL